jgi:integrase/recombinase XerD
MILNTNYTSLLNAYAQCLKTLGFAQTTVYDFTHFTKYFLYYLQNKNINHIKLLTAIIVKTYFTHLENTTGKRTNRAFSASHLNRQFIAIDKFLEFLHTMGLNSAPLPTKYSVEHKATKAIVVLSVGQIQLLYNTIPLLFDDLTMAKREPNQACVRLMLDLCYGCGLRRFEAINLKIKDVNFDTKIIHVVQGKNYKDRLVPMSNAVSKALQTFIYEHRKGFTNKRDGFVYPHKSQALAQALHFLVNNCNDKTLQDLHPTLHSLRHSIATHLLQKGMNIENIARFLGHSSLQSTQLYTHLVEIINEKL